MTDPARRSTATFRAELRRFLDAHAPEGATGGRGREVAGIPDWARRWQAELFDGGWLVPENPPGRGGRNASVDEQLAYLEEMAARGLVRSVHYPGYGIVAPTLERYGTEDHKVLITPALRGDHVWCVGMSEPDAGSDLGSLRTRARADGGRFVLEGRKIWTSFADHADFCLCYARTGEEADRRAGISVLIVDMRSPGVEVRPLRQVTGNADFAEVLFDAVEVPATNLVGTLGDGWRIALDALGFERRGLWVDWLAGVAYAMEQAILLARRSGAVRQPVVAAELATAYERVSSVFSLGLRGIGEQAGDGLGVHSLLKLAVSELAVDLSDLAVRLGYPVSIEPADSAGEGAPPAGAAGGGTPVAGTPVAANLDALLRSLGDTVGGGTPEMQRNTIAARLLGRRAGRAVW